MKSKKNLIILAMVIAISLLGVTYAFFDYYRIGANQKITAGKVNLILNDGTTNINLTNVFPETVEKARKEGRTDNIVTFTVSGTNTTEDQDIYYEIMLNEGDPETGMTRFNPEDLVFDLIEVNGETETYLVDAMSFSDINARRIWVNTVDRNNATTVNKTYKLRMWLSEDVLISDSNPNANYPATGYENYYASVKVSVYGDFVEKTNPYNYMARLGTSELIEEGSGMYSFWPDEILAQSANITEVNFVSMKQTEMQQRYTAATIKEDMTDTTKSEAGSVLAWLEPGEVVNIEGTDTQQYKMYVASEGTTFFPSDASLMFAMFMSATEINFDNVNTSKVTDMMLMFAFNSSLSSLDLSDWDTSKVTNMMAMFAMCANLTNLEISNWDTRNVTDMSEMFGGVGLTTIDLSDWDTSSVTNIDSMFIECENLTSLDLSNWNTYNVTNMSGIFDECTNLESINLSGWVMGTEFPSFYGLTNLTTVNLSNVDTSNVTGMGSVFYGCSSLTTLDLSDLDTSNVTDMTMMFSGCTSLTTIYANSDWSTGNITVSNAKYVFEGCTSLVGAVPFDSTKTDITMANPTTGYFTKK